MHIRTYVCVCWLQLKITVLSQGLRRLLRLSDYLLFIVLTFRATRAEEVTREALRKCHVKSFQPSPTPTLSLSEWEVFTPIAIEEKPFWVVPREEIEFTHEDIGKGRWGIVRVVTYRGKRVAARCLYMQSNHFGGQPEDL